MSLSLTRPQPPTMAKQQPGVSPCVLQELEDAEGGAAAFFTCRSGELLWGQVHTVIQGFAATGVDGPQPGSSFLYRVGARRGQWKVEAVLQGNSEGDPCHLGFVCYHVDVDGVEVVRRAAEAGIGGGGKFADLEIVFVDRYDWSGSCSPGCEVIVQAVEGREINPEEEDFENEPYYRSLLMGRFMLVDVEGFPNLMQALKNGKRIEGRNYVMRWEGDDTVGKSSSLDPKSEGENKTASNCGGFGTHLVVGGSEYDMGWMAFQNGELVGFVYDGAYSGLEDGDLRVGKNLVPTQNILPCICRFA